MKHAEFHISYIWVALATALGAGFAIGASMALAMGYGLPFVPAFDSLIQTHGHLQLVGWAGLFIMGVSLYFMPRLAGVPLARPQWCTGILGLMATGLGLRSMGQIALLVLRTPVVGLWLLIGSGLLEWCGILLYVFLLLGTMRGLEGGHGRPALLAVRPYVGMMVGGWSVYACLNLLLLLHMALRRSVVVHQGWNAFAVQVFMGLVLLPVAFAFSVRTFPLYLRLPGAYTRCQLPLWCSVWHRRWLWLWRTWAWRAKGGLFCGSCGNWTCSPIIGSRGQYVAACTPAQSADPLGQGCPTTESLAGLNASCMQRTCGSSWARAATWGEGPPHW
jgi:hypothetical protein